VSPDQGGSWLAGPKPPGAGWTQNKFVFLITFVFALHVALIFILGGKKPIVPRTVTNVPRLQLADNAGELIALDDPTLFARPNAHDFVTAFWQRPQIVAPPNFDWTEAPRYLPPPAEKLGASFREFMQSNRPPERALNFKPEPRMSEAVVNFDSALPPATTLQISGELARRRQLNPVELPSIPVNDVIPPSKVQALVDPAGNIASAVLLESSANNDADQLALKLVRNLRFAPAPRLMFGEIIFNWHTVPTNAP
jgi:TonB family protein